MGFPPPPSTAEARTSWRSVLPEVASGRGPLIPWAQKTREGQGGSRPDDAQSRGDRPGAKTFCVNRLDLKQGGV